MIGEELRQRSGWAVKNRLKSIRGRAVGGDWEPIGDVDARWHEALGRATNNNCESATSSSAADASGGWTSTSSLAPPRREASPLRPRPWSPRRSISAPAATCAGSAPERQIARQVNQPGWTWRMRRWRPRTSGGLPCPREALRCAHWLGCFDGAGGAGSSCRASQTLNSVPVAARPRVPGKTPGRR